MILLIEGGSVGKWSVVGSLIGRWSVDLMNSRKKHVWSGDFACAICSRFILFFYFYLFIYLFYIDNKEKLNLIARRSHSHLYLFLKIYKYDDKTKPTGISPNIYVIYKKLLQAFQKSICLVKEFFLVNPFIGHRCFLRNITTSFTTVTSRNTTLF